MDGRHPPGDLGLRFGAIFIALSLGAVLIMAIGIGLIVGHTYLVGVPLAVIGFAAVIGTGKYASAAGIYMRTILYRFATDRPIPDLGVNISGAFRPR